MAERSGRGKVSLEGDDTAHGHSLLLVDIC